MFNAFMSFVGSMLIAMYAIGVCNIAMKLFLMLTDPAALETPLANFKVGTQGGTALISF